MKKSIAIIALGVCFGASVTGCQTISEEACLSGSWEDIGFKDGEAGRSRSRLADISERCAKFNVMPDRIAYIRGLELGLQRYCGPSTGYDHGRSGQSPNAECDAGGFADYLDGYADGNEVYQLESERNDLISRWSDQREAYLNVSGRLEAEDLSAKERRRLEKKAARLANDMDDLRIDIRAMEQLHGLPRWSPPTD
ncbi:hypothetical protein GCM10009069_03620 [Algimonas arctica]|uniref:DUF2799 domain-containing protein n=1 Tax=Algimonas arctica TaxID=1479486 RepID=A0A8J3CLF8_9PROT|nr:DUF2799 domain-containing protein [Algimonas arctica]GHA83596.1 hypothetical protein GCM10009069_03620 [Algimonas arctica]